MALLIGCGSSHSGPVVEGDAGRRDAGGPPDAGERRDAPRRDADPEPDAGPSSPIRAGFEVTAQIDAERQREGIPASQSFTVWIDEQNSTLVAGRAGQTAEVPLTAAGEQLETTEAFSLPVDSDEDCAQVRSLQYMTLSLQPQGRTADGQPERLTGTAEGRVNVIQGDVGEIVAFSASIDAPRDTTPPTLSAPETHHVVDSIRIGASEPLPQGTQASLATADGSTTIELIAKPQDGAVGRFVNEEAMLPFGASLTVQPDPELDDLEGTGPVEPAVTVQTIADPGLLPESGFETGDAPDRMYLNGGAELVNSIGELPAIEGDRSLLLPEQSRATFRLDVDSGHTHVHASLRLLGRYSSGAYFGGSLTAYRMGSGTQRSAELEQQHPGTESVETGADDWSHAGSAQQVRIPIPEGEGDVVLDVRGSSSPCGGLAPAPAGLLLDEVRTQASDEGDASGDEGAPAETDCAPQDIHSRQPCHAVLGIKWNGEQCVTVSGCSCDGIDCEALYDSREQCRREHAHCSTDAPQCETENPEGCRDDSDCQQGYTCEPTPTQECLPSDCTCTEDGTWDCNRDACLGSECRPADAS
jgi:hypothetical protein